MMMWIVLQLRCAMYIIQKFHAKPLRQMEKTTIVLLEGLGTLAVLVAQMCG